MGKPDRDRRPIRVGDAVRVTCPEPWLDGLVVRVIGLRVRSCSGRVGVAVQYSARSYAVVRADEVERAN